MLEAMGITVWRQRDTAPPENIPAPRIRCIAQALHADEPLLHKILQAIGCPLNEAQVIWVDNPDTLSLQDLPPAPTIVFGEDLYAHAPSTAIRTLSLTALADNVHAKKTLWQSLQALS